MIVRRTIIVTFVVAAFLIDQSAIAVDQPAVSQSHEKIESRKLTDQEIDAHKRSQELSDRLIQTIIGGVFVTFLGLFAKREIDIFELSNLCVVLRTQILIIQKLMQSRNEIASSTQLPESLVPISVDDFKPMARYMSPSDFVALLQASAIVSRFGELQNELPLTGDSDAAKRELLTREIEVLKGRLHNLVVDGKGTFFIWAAFHTKIYLWGPFIPGFWDVILQPFRERENSSLAASNSPPG